MSQIFNALTLVKKYNVMYYNFSAKINMNAEVPTHVGSVRSSILHGDNTLSCDRACV